MMRRALVDRELITLDAGGPRVCGTYHMPPSREGAASQVGVVFFNTLSDPRSGGGDTAVYWAEALAAGGYPVFRLDLPGLGDTDGEIPCELLSFITANGFAPVLHQKLRELVDRFGLAGVVLVGHCAGAVTALYAAQEQKLCRGVILLDPYFTRPKWITAKAQPGLIHFARKTRIGSFLRKSFDFAWDMLRSIRRHELPKNANVAMLGAWMQAASKGLPILVLRSPGAEPKAGQFDYLEYAMTLAGKKAQITLKRIENTDHSFANRAGKQAAARSMEAWMGRFWPQEAVKHEFQCAPVPVSKGDGLSKKCVPA